MYIDLMKITLSNNLKQGQNYFIITRWCKSQFCFRKRWYL